MTLGKLMTVPAQLARKGDELTTNQGSERITEIVRDGWEVLITTPTRSLTYARSDQITLRFQK